MDPMSYLFSRDRWLPGVYHVWVKAVDGVWLFRDDQDRAHLEFLINRHLSEQPWEDSRGRPYASLRVMVRMLARNVLSSHFHLILWQLEPGGIEKLMHRVLTSYARYYHERYGTSGPLVKGRYRARLIEDRSSFRWRVAYVHFNQRSQGLDWKFSSHRYFAADEPPPSWLEVGLTLEKFGGREEYLRYLDQYRELRLEDPVLDS